MPKKAKAGRKKKLTPEQVQMAADKYAEGEYSMESIALAMGVSHETVRRALRALKE
ncbi:helix-turn-helix domain-containing protein [Aeromonas taiwanensis]